MPRSASAWRNETKPLADLYERVGFVVVGREGDALTMRRELPGGAS